jgi:hypothetical protein
MKLFPEIIRTLYDQDVLAEDTILLWFRKGQTRRAGNLICLFLLNLFNMLPKEGSNFSTVEGLVLGSYVNVNS